MTKKGYNLVHVIIIIIVTAIVSAISIGILYSKGFTNENGMRYTELLDDENIKEFLDVYSQIINEYYEDIDKEKAIQSAINGLITYLDESYTTYMSPDEATALKELLNGSYYGLGITLKDKTITSVHSASPASEAGIMPGDIIISINNESVSNKGNAEILNIIKDSIQLDLTLLRNNNEFKVTLVPENLKIPSVEYEIIDNSIGYIRINVFANGVASEIENALKTLKLRENLGFIIDLRDNSGGYLDEAYDTASLFLGENQVIYYLSDKNESIAYIDKTEDKTSQSMVVLVNQNTASAAEILAAALKDSYGATLVGLNTYGKGKIQHTFSLNTGGLVKYTTSKWLRPNGLCVDNVGIKPDIVLSNTINDDTNNSTIEDVQLKKGIELLSK